MFYAEPSDPSAFYQGDIVADVPFFSVPPDPLVVRPAQGQPAFRPEGCKQVRIHLAGLATLADAFAAGPEGFVLRAERRLVQIISQTCDIQHRTHVFVAPVLGRSDMRQADLWEKIARNRVIRYFWLPATDGLENCAADISKILAVRRDMLDIHNRVATLSPQARSLLQQRLSAFLTRPFEE